MSTPINPDQFRPHPDAVLLGLRAGPHSSVLEWKVGPERQFTKIHADLSRLNREHEALTTWARQLQQSPDVLARGHRHLLLTAVPGVSTPAAGLPKEAWRAAGSWLRAAHALPEVPEDPMALGDALYKRLRRLVRQARTHLPHDLVDRCLEVIGDPRMLAQERVWCHRDFTPSNWLWEPSQQQLSVIDFEHSRPDTPWADLQKLEATAFVHHPAARVLFYEGYGTPAEPSHRAAFVAWHGLATITWGRRHRDSAFSLLGRQVLEDSGILAPETPLSVLAAPATPLAR